MFATQPTPKPEGKRLRRKLQKISNHNRLPTKLGTIPEVESPWSSKSTLGPGTPETHGAMPRWQKGLSPDLSDAKWQEFVRKSSYLQPMVWQDNDVVPELAHLGLGDAQPRKSSETASSNSDASTLSPQSSVSSRRRYAKTPVHSIGQLEMPKATEPLTAEKLEDIDALAESYRALLHSRMSLLTDRHSVRSPSIYEDCLEPEMMEPLVPVEIRVESPATTPLSPKLGMGSPATSDDGTLVGFDDDPIYFKPVSFETKERSTQQRHEVRDSTYSSATIENPSLQICFDFLTTELSSAVQNAPRRPGAETSALQIWVMIEAYEKMRNQVMRTTRNPDEAKSLEAMFDMWLAALHSAHDRMEGTDDQRSISDYGGSASDVSVY